ncbi:MAG: histidine phosphatase family protein [Acidobacteriota bacterium]
MLIIISSLILTSFGVAVLGQKKTIILVRHAEKDTSETANKNDPELSAEGKARADRFYKLAKKFRPGAIYSSDYKRTRSTVEKLAANRNLDIKTYDPKDQKRIVDEIMKSSIKRYVISGHSNTIPLLANLLINKEIFKLLDESEYGTVWVIRMSKGKLKKVEVLSY